MKTLEKISKKDDIFKFTTEKICPMCGSTDVFETKHKTKWRWFAVCRNCWFKESLDKFYL